MLSAQRLRRQGPRALAELGRRLPRRHRDPDRVLAPGRGRPTSARRWRRAASTTPTSSSTRTRAAQKKWNYLVRVGAVSAVSRAAGQADPASRWPRSATPSLQALRVVGGRRQDLPALRPSRSSRRCWRNSLKAIGVNTTQVQRFGRAEDNTYEVTLVGLDSEIRRALDAQAGRGRGGGDPEGRVGRRQGRQRSCATTASSRCCSRSC